MSEPHERYEAFKVVHSNGEASGISDLEMNRELEKRAVENVFPFEVFHPQAKHYMQQMHTHMDIPRSFIGLNMLTAYSSAIGTSYAVKRGSDHVYMVMWSCMHGMTSSGKTVPLNMIFKPLRDIQRNFDQEYDKAEAARSSTSVDADGNIKERDYNVRTERIPDILIQNVHINTLMRTALPDNPKGLTLEFDELMEWINAMNNSTGKDTIDEQVYLKGWSGAAYRGLRANRVKFSVPRIYVNVIGGIQPEITYKLFKNDRDVTGFTFRILFASAPDRIALPDSTWTMPKEVEDNHKRCLQSMYNGLHVWDPFQEPRVLELTEGAAKMHQEWKRARAITINEMTDRMEKNIHAGILGKIGEYAWRFAGLLAVSDRAYENRSFATHIEIDSSYMERAIKLAEYFYQSAWDVYGSVNTRIIASPDVLRWAAYVKAGWSQQRIGDAEFLNVKSPEARRRKAGRELKKMIMEFPKVFNAITK